MENKKFSVSMCVYGGDNAGHFSAAVESVLNQTVPPDELVLVVDGPVPEALDAVITTLAARDEVRVLRFPENRGHGEARRAGLAACQNELVAIMDADDLSAPDRFRQQLAYFENEGVDIVGGDIAEFIGEESNVVAYRRVPATDAEIKDYIKKRCPFNQMTVMFRKCMYEKAGGYIDWYCDEDYYLWLRMMLNGAVFANTGTVLVHARVGEDMYRRRGGWRYFKSERALQKYMRKTGVIGTATYTANVAKRFIVQVLLPNRLRGWVFKKFA
ncbi:MAG: glycosyltransferase, partial [Clostridia bacterium]|nr:glycosyltransferase [Clostridia bacterium]